MWNGRQEKAVENLFILSVYKMNQCLKYLQELIDFDDLELYSYIA